MDDINMVKMGQCRVAGRIGSRVQSLAAGALVGLSCAALFIVVSPAELVGWSFSWGRTKSPTESASYDKDVVGWFFDDAYAHSGYHYAYPPVSSVKIVKGNAKRGRCSCCMELAVDDYSGASICLKDHCYDLRPVIKSAALQFWIRGSGANEKAIVALVDEDASDGKKTVVRVPLEWFGRIGAEWSLVSIPLESFVKLNERGLYWDGQKGQEVSDDFDWNRVAEFRIESRKDENASFEVFVDDVVIVKTIR